MKIMLFTLPTCKYCTPAKELLKDKKEVEIINLDDSEELGVKYGIRSVPTLVAEDCNGVTTYVGLDRIEKFVEEKMASKSCCGCK
ncbi:glutaredoxin [Cetobacterium sp. 8H]|uniref:glutaredoxin family protein n=1 Tax=Cetobacterium sp. 8H TaxID=2759681 RepID=UPI001C8DC182|nr:glutaredoxin [Cetobacterium sp. 8H]